LNVPGVLHIECAAKWSQERPSQALPGRSSGFTSHLHPEALDDCVLPTSLPLPQNHPNIPQRAAVPAHPPLPRDQAQNVAGMRHYRYEDTHVEKDDPKRALQDIFVNAMKGVEAKRWVSSDIAQPNTVEFWVRIFKVHMCHNADKWTLQPKDFVQYITRVVLNIKRRRGLGLHGTSLEGIV
jgi:hypothetical protein